MKKGTPGASFSFYERRNMGSVHFMMFQNLQKCPKDPGRSSKITFGPEFIEKGWYLVTLQPQVFAASTFQKK
jgi:hypothetical protein